MLWFLPGIVAGAAIVVFLWFRADLRAVLNDTGCHLWIGHEAENWQEVAGFPGALRE